MLYRDKRKNHGVSLELVHGDNSENESFFIVEGDDNLWVNGVASRLSEVLNSLQTQRAFSFRYHFQIPAVILFTIMCAALFNALRNENVPPWWGEDFGDLIGLSFGCGIFLGYIAAKELFSHKEKFWPSVEIQVGPMHTFLEKKRREFLWLVISLVLIPLALSVLVSLPLL